MRKGILNVEILELEAALGVINQSFQTVAFEFGLTIENCPTNGAFIKADRLMQEYKKGNLMYGYYEDDKLIGFAEITHMKDTQYSLDKLSVLPDYRHKGIGEKLVYHGASLVSQLGGKNIIIGIIDEDIRLKNWFLKLGFGVIETRQTKHLPFTVGIMNMKLSNT